MSDVIRPIARQGTNDGLCGIYCLINAVRDDEKLRNSSGEDILRYLLEAASRLGILVPSKIADGYEEHELVDIFNEFARCLDLTWKAKLLITLKRSFPKLSQLVLSKRVFEEGGKFVLHTRDHEHWFLAYSYDFDKGSYLVEDSNLQDEKFTISHKRVQNIGVVLLPAHSLLANAH